MSTRVSQFSGNEDFYPSRGSMLMSYETQTGDIAAPVTVALGDGHVVILYNSTKARYFVCTYANTGWRMVEAF